MSGVRSWLSSFKMLELSLLVLYDKDSVSFKDYKFFTTKDMVASLHRCLCLPVNSRC